MSCDQRDAAASDVYLEAVPFASRLQVLGVLVQGSRIAGRRAVVVAPPRRTDAHFNEWVKGLPEGVGLVVAGTAAEPGASVSARSLRGLLRQAGSLLEPGGALHLTALDDYMGSVWAALPGLLMARRKAVQIFVYKYRVEDVRHPHLSFRSMAAWGVTRLVLLATGGVLVTFDERMEGQSRTWVLPDPWDGDFGLLSPQSARASLGLSPDLETVGLIGYQDRRKGFATSVAALLDLKASGWPGQILMLGRVAQEYDDLLCELSEAYGDRLTQQSEFVTDAELPTYFAASDSIWAPYDPSFSSTSGVLARAAASGRPVIVTDRGLMAYRVKRHALGDTVPPFDSHALAEAQRRGTAGFDPKRAAQFAAASHSDTVARSFASMLGRGRR